jgi:phytoene dehydrogenase-like protein
MKKNYDADVIVVGSGHNGLITAAYLAKWGYRVLVFERRDTIGGAVCTEEMFGGFKMDVGGSAHFMIHHTPIVGDLELYRYGLEYIPMEPFMSAPFPDGTVIKFYRDLDATCESIARISERDAESYRTFINDWQPLNKSVFESFLKPPTGSNIGKTFILSQLRKSTRRRNEFLQNIMKSYGRLIDDTFESEYLRAALAWWGAQSGPPPSDTASAEFIGWHSMIHLKGAARPRGGSGMLTQALRKYIEAHDGIVYPGMEIKRIEVTGGKAAGVELLSGERFSCRAVVSNAHVKVTLLDLLRDDISPSLRSRAEKINTGNGFGMVIRCAMERLPEYAVPGKDREEILNGLQLLSPTTQYLFDSYADFLKLYPSEKPAAVGMTFSAIDPSLAPNGKHILFVWGQYYPYRLRNGLSWENIREREAGKLLRVVDEFAPGTSDQLIDWYIQTPDVIEKKHAMPNANVMHVEMTLDQMFTFRPLPELSAYRTPIKGLFLSSAGMHPGGGIFGAAGYNCSSVVRRYLRRRFF